MTSPRNGSPTRALVLGGGGAVGVGWQAGLLTGLREAGLDLAGANATTGTSAGALVGALLSSGRDVTGALTSLAALGRSIDPDGLCSAHSTVEPDFSDTQAPANMMDPNLAIQAFQAGKRQAEREAAAIQAAWNS